jgi:Asp-tRNA(Asn)/Glu-tRNA(Gln) amidotransferase C subunit
MDCQKTSKKNAFWLSKTRETILSATINRITTLVTKVLTIDSHQIKTKVRKIEIKILTTHPTRESRAGSVTREITPKWDVVPELNKTNP